MSVWDVKMRLGDDRGKRGGGRGAGGPFGVCAETPFFKPPSFFSRKWGVRKPLPNFPVEKSNQGFGTGKWYQIRVSAHLF